jgi:hypothetical protein
VRRVAVTLVACFLCALFAGAPAFGAGDGAGGVHDPTGDPSLRVGLRIFAPGGDGTRSFGPHDPGAPSPIRYLAIAAHSPPPGLDNLCNAAPGGPGGPAIAWGWWYTIETISNATGLTIASNVVCEPLPAGTTPGNAAAPTVVLPTPPTIAEIWDATGIPAPVLGVNPTAEGVVGLGTWLWSGGATARQVAVSVGGFTVTGTAHLSTYRFDPGDGAAALTTTVPGSGTAPAVTYLYDVKGTYQLAVASLWDADVTMTGPGFAAPLPVAIGTAVVTTARAYPVVEVRSVLLP